MTAKEAEPGAGISQLISTLLPRLWPCPGAGAAVAPGGSSTPGMVPCQVSVCLPRVPKEPEQGRKRCHPRTGSFPDSLPIAASPRQMHRRTDSSVFSMRASGGATDPKNPAAPLCHAHPTGLSPQAGREGIPGQGSELSFVNSELTETGRTALANISKVPCNSSLLFSSFVCFPLKKAVGTFQVTIKSLLKYKQLPGPQSSADGPIPAPIQAPACPWRPAALEGGMYGH